jgi:hypothetical protein
MSICFFHLTPPVSPELGNPTHGPVSTEEEVRGLNLPPQIQQEKHLPVDFI